MFTFLRHVWPLIDLDGFEENEGVLRTPIDFKNSLNAQNRKQTMEILKVLVRRVVGLFIPLNKRIAHS